MLLSYKEIRLLRRSLEGRNPDWVGVTNKIFAHLNECHKRDQAKEVSAKVGFVDVAINAGKDGTFGTKDDRISLSISKKKAPAKKK
jgi:hypothetical protein